MDALKEANKKGVPTRRTFTDVLRGVLGRKTTPVAMATGHPRGLGASKIWQDAKNRSGVRRSGQGDEEN
jgi:hypothetical protein